jgi:exodeoxyribonuclease III
MTKLFRDFGMPAYRKAGTHFENQQLMKLLSWNVNGIRACLNKGLMEYIQSAQADVFCLQEVKAQPSDVASVTWPAGYQTHWNSAQKKGYSGTLVLTRQKPLSVVNGIGLSAADSEGRAITVEYPTFFLVNVYVPNAQPELARLAFRQAWDRALLAYLKKLETMKPVVLCGDLNVAHEEIDLARPKENVGNPGFSNEERDGFRTYLKAGWVDTFRHFEKGPNHYSWWTYRAGARERNIGWRIDYFLTSGALTPALQKAWIQPEILGSDHCPVGLTLKA